MKEAIKQTEGVNLDERIIVHNYDLITCINKEVWIHLLCVLVSQGYCKILYSSIRELIVAFFWATKFSLSFFSLCLFFSRARASIKNHDYPNLINYA